MANLLHRSDEFVTFYNKLSKISPSTPTYFGTRVRRLRVVVWIDLHVSLRGQLHPKCEQAIHLMYQIFFCKLPPSSNPTNKNVTGAGSGDSNSSISLTFHSQTHVLMNMCLTMTDNITSQNSDLSSPISLCYFNDIYSWWVKRREIEVVVYLKYPDVFTKHTLSGYSTDVSSLITYLKSSTS